MIDDATVRDLIFIGHANPADNDFALWIAARLRALGYSVFLDQHDLIGGEQDFWAEIQRVLEQRTIKYLLVLTPGTFKAQGVLDEWEHAKSLQKTLGVKDFILPLRVSPGVSFNARIGLNRINAIDFVSAWAQGLQRLNDKLVLDKVPKDPSRDIRHEVWMRSRGSHLACLVRKRDQLVSNWIKIPRLPAQMWLYNVPPGIDRNELSALNDPVPFILHGTNNVVSFDCNLKLPWASDEGLVKVKPVKVSTGKSSDGFPNGQDIQRFKTQLLRIGIERLFAEKCRGVFEMSRRRRCYFFHADQEEATRFTFRALNVQKTKHLVGQYHNAHWHYAMAISIRWLPFPAFSLHAHLMFTDDGKTVWPSAARRHRARRSKGRRFFNSEWRDLMLAFLSAMATDGKLRIPLSRDQTIEVSSTPDVFDCKYSFAEPEKLARTLPLDDELEEEDALLGEHAYVGNKT